MCVGGGGVGVLSYETKQIDEDKYRTPRLQKGALRAVDIPSHNWLCCPLTVALVLGVDDVVFAEVADNDVELRMLANALIVFCSKIKIKKDHFHNHDYLPSSSDLG